MRRCVACSSPVLGSPGSSGRRLGHVAGWLRSCGCGRSGAGLRRHGRSTAPRRRMTLCVPTSLTSATRQSSATRDWSCSRAIRWRARASCGPAKRSCIGTLPTPANICDSSTWSAPRLLTQSTPLALMMALAALLRLTQTMIVGGSSVTEQTAEQVNPAMPCGPSVVTTETEDATRDSASRNSSADTWVADFRNVSSIGHLFAIPDNADRTSVWVSISLSPFGSGFDLKRVVALRSSCC